MSLNLNARPAPASLSSLANCYREVRRATERLCDPLATEDYVIQSMPDASPVKWHLAHTTWFYETFLLLPHLAGYRPFRPEFAYLFNSYYEGVGPRWPRARRGLLSRPTVEEVRDYRAHVDSAMASLFRAETDSLESLESLVFIGLNHEQQHQELIVTDLKHAWTANPLSPPYCEMRPEASEPPAQGWVTYPEGVVSIGHDGESFAYDNESPRHRVFLNGFQLARRLTTNADFLAFIADGGYARPELWLSDGWAACRAAGWTAPLYWEWADGKWFAVTLSGRRPVVAEEPVCHVSYYEADAFARWAGARLPTEAEWETVAAEAPLAGHFQEGGRFHPAALPAADDSSPVRQLFGDVWQWTASPYVGYPGYRPAAGAIGEYNGKFMVNQMVLRGASCATPRSHARRTYRNFFPPDARWQLSGIRLAQDAE